MNVDSDIAHVGKTVHLVVSRIPSPPRPRCGAALNIILMMAALRRHDERSECFINGLQKEGQGLGNDGFHSRKFSRTKHRIPQSFKSNLESPIPSRWQRARGVMSSSQSTRLLSRLGRNNSKFDLKDSGNEHAPEAFTDFERLWLSFAAGHHPTRVRIPDRLIGRTNI